MFSALHRAFATHARSLGAVLAVPRVRRVAASSFIARLPKGMLPLATILLLHETTGSYALAGLAAALTAVGDAATTPVQARLVDRFGVARVLLPIAGIHVIAVGCLALFVTYGAWPAGLVVSAAVAGIGMPPVSGSVKAAWPRLVDQPAAAYALESLLQQVLFLAGPLLVAIIVAVAGPLSALLTAAALLFAGTAWFGTTVPKVTIAKEAVTSSAWRLPAVQVLSATTFLQGIAFGAEPVGLSAFAAGAGAVQLTGLVQAMLTFGGILGTFAPVGADDRCTYVRMLTGFSALLLPMPLLATHPVPGTLLSAGITLAMAGLFLTPIAAASYVLVSRPTPADCRTEAFGWLSTGLAAGNAIGAAVGGLVADHFGTVASLTLMPVAVALSAVLAQALSRDKSL